MTTDIFICSFPRDVRWLEYCLKSIKKFVTGYEHIHIAWPKSEHIPSFITDELIHGDAATVTHGYSRHQVSKMRAAKYSKADVVAFLDCDHFCLKPTDMSHFYDVDKPQIWSRPYSVLAQLPDGVTGVTRAACKWQAPAEHALGFQTPYFTMEFLPLLHHRDVLLECVAYIEKLHGKSLEAYANSLHWTGFGDYLVMGSYALKFHPDRYSQRTIAGDHDWRFAGYSPYACHGGLTPEIAANFDRILSTPCRDFDSFEERNNRQLLGACH